MAPTDTSRGQALDAYGSAMPIRVGTSGWSYPSWRPGFYPAGLQPAEFLGFYAARFDTVELNSTGYRLPSADQFRRWADAVPDGFEFSVKLSLTRLDRVTTFLERAKALGDRLGPVRIVYEGPRDDGVLSFVEGSIPEGTRLAWDFRHETWDGVAGVRARRRSGRRAVPLPPPSRAALFGRRARGRRDDGPRPGISSTSGTRTSRRRPRSPSVWSRSCAP